MVGSGESSNDNSMVRRSAQSRTICVGLGGTHSGTLGLAVVEVGGVKVAAMMFSHKYYSHEIVL